MEPGQEIPRHADVAVPHVGEPHLAELGPDAPEAVPDVGLEPVGAVEGRGEGASGDQAVAGVVAGEPQLAVGVGNRGRFPGSVN